MRASMSPMPRVYTAGLQSTMSVSRFQGQPESNAASLMQNKEKLPELTLSERFMAFFSKDNLAFGYQAAKDYYQQKSTFDRVMETIGMTVVLAIYSVGFFAFVPLGMIWPSLIISPPTIRMFLEGVHEAAQRKKLHAQTAKTDS